MARQVEFSPWEAWTMSLIVHAGSAQFTALGMWEATSAIPIILTTLVINLRHLLMGASMAPHRAGYTRCGKRSWLCGCPTNPTPCPSPSTGEAEGATGIF